MGKWDKINKDHELQRWKTHPHELILKICRRRVVVWAPSYHNPPAVFPHSKLFFCSIIIQPCWQMQIKNCTYSSQPFDSEHIGLPRFIPDCSVLRRSCPYILPTLRFISFRHRVAGLPFIFSYCMRSILGYFMPFLLSSLRRVNRVFEFLLYDFLWHWDGPCLQVNRSIRSLFRRFSFQGDVSQNFILRYLNSTQLRFGQGSSLWIIHKGRNYTTVVFDFRSVLLFKINVFATRNFSVPSIFESLSYLPLHFILNSNRLSQIFILSNRF